MTYPNSLPPRPSPVDRRSLEARVTELEAHVVAIETELDNKSVRIMKDHSDIVDRIEDLERGEKRLRKKVASLPDDGEATITGVHRLEKLQEAFRGAVQTETQLALAKRDLESMRAKAATLEKRESIAEIKQEKKAEKKDDRRWSIVFLVVSAVVGIAAGALGAHCSGGTTPPPVTTEHAH